MAPSCAPPTPGREPGKACRVCSAPGKRRKQTAEHTSAPFRARRYPPGTKTALCLLLAARVVGALINTVHDCDEVYNYWEPLHFLLYGSGMQTWEYRCAAEAGLQACKLRELTGWSPCSSQFALRSYWYLIMHNFVAGPAAIWFGDGKGVYLHSRAAGTVE